MTKMALFIWSEQLSVGLTTIDKEHRKLVNILNSLHHALSKGEGKEIVGAVLAELIQYTGTHFANEEELMRKHGYPEFEQHRGIHKTLVRNVLDFQIKHKAGEVNTIEVMKFVTEWLKKHIMETDKKYAPCLAANGVI